LNRTKNRKPSHVL